MKKLFLLFIMLISLSMAGQDTYNENFDVAASWTGTNLNAYGAQYYTNSAVPVNDQFSTNLGVREGSGTSPYYLHSAPYAWRIQQGTGGNYLRYECEETVHGFQIWAARWDPSPAPVVYVRYSTNSGASYTNIDTVYSADFTGDKVYKLLSYTFGSAISPESGLKIYIEFYTVSGERMLYDDFQITYGVSTVNNPTAFDAVPFSTTQNDMTWGLNGNGDAVMVAHNSENIFGVPSGDYTEGASIDGGGTVLYNGTGTSTSHTSLTPDTEYYYKIWSKGSSGDYSSGLVDSATTYKIEPSEYPATFTVNATGITVTADWAAAGGIQAPDGYLLKISNADNITAPVDGTPVANDRDLSNGSGAMNVASSVLNFTFFRLAPTTTYYVKIYPYTNSGAVIDYKTDGEAPSGNALTQAILSTNDFESNTFGTWTTYSVASNKNWLVVDTIGAYGTTHSAYINGYQGDVISNDWLISPSLNLGGYSNEMIVFFTAWRFGAGDTELTFKYSTDYTSGDPTLATWTDISFTKATLALTWVPSGFIDISGIAGTNVHFAFQYLGIAFDNTTRNWRVDEIEITGDGVSDPTNFNATTISSDQINLSWTKNINSDDVMVAYSTTNTFGIPFDFIPEGGEIDGGGTVLYRGQEESFGHGGLESGIIYYYKAWSVDPSNTYSSGVTDNATTQFSEPTNHPTAFLATANGFNQITVTWTDSDATGYLVKGSSVGYGSIVPPVDLIGQGDSALVKNISAGTQTAVFTGLTENTTYYFQIYPYNGVGTSANYKTDGEVPQTSAITDVFHIDLIITEVSDPSDNFDARFVEIMNIGTTSFNFNTTIVYLSRQANGSGWADVKLTGILNPGDTYVITTNGTNYTAAYGISADLVSGIVTGSGDDGYFLYYGGPQSTGILIDAFGVIGQDGTGFDWEYLDTKAVRKRSVTAPNTTWTASEWVIPAVAQTKDMTPDFHNGTVTWQGTTSTNWNAKSDNWNSPNGYIPDASCNVIIPFTDIINFPSVTEASAVNELLIESGSTVIVSGTGSLQVVGQP